MHPDDERLARLLRSLRNQAHLTQQTLASNAGIPVDDVIDIEAARLNRVRVERLRLAFAAVDARIRVNAWWHGANADRLLDEAHASIVETVAALFVRRGWQTKPEFSFNEYGERGSIDLFACHVETRAVAVCEIKSTFGSLEEANRVLDVKVRLSPKFALNAFGFRPRYVGRLLVVPDNSTTRGIVRRHQTTMDLVYPERSRAVHAWLRRPNRSISAIWFLSNLGDSQAGAA